MMKMKKKKQSPRMIKHKGRQKQGACRPWQAGAYLSLSPSVRSYKWLAPPSAQALKRASSKKNTNYVSKDGKAQSVA